MFTNRWSRPTCLSHPIFENLTLGYRALDSEGRWIAHCVDDLTHLRG